MDDPQLVRHKTVAMVTLAPSNGATKSAIYGRIHHKPNIYKLQNSMFKYVQHGVQVT